MEGPAAFCCQNRFALQRGEIWNTPPAAAFMETVTACLLPLRMCRRKWPSKGDAAGCLDTHATINDPAVEKPQKQPTCVWCVSSGVVTEITNPKKWTRQREGFYFVLHCIFTERWPNPIWTQRYFYNIYWNPVRAGSGIDPLLWL